MAAARVGSVSAGTATTVTFPQTPTPGNLIIITVVATRSLTATPATTLNNGAYGTIDSGDFTIGTNHLRITQFWKFATASEAAPTITATNLTEWTVEEISGISAHDSDSAGAGSSANTQTTSTTPVASTSFEYTTLAKNNAEAVTWSNGAVADAGPSTASGWSIYSAFKSVTGTSASSNTATWTTAVQSGLLTSGWKLKNVSVACGIGAGNGVMSG